MKKLILFLVILLCNTSCLVMNAPRVFLTHQLAESAREASYPSILTSFHLPATWEGQGGWGAVAAVDIDGDGDLDLFFGRNSAAIMFFRNVGTPTRPHYVAVFGAENPLNAGVSWGRSSPQFVDIDNDGDFDLIIGTGWSVSFYENTGSATAPVFTARTGAANPMNGFTSATNRTSPALVDLDNDGDLDLMWSNNAAVFQYFENTGDASTPAFAERTGAANPMNGIDAGHFGYPAFADLDNDGDFDLFVATSGGTINYYKNTGTSSAPVFALTPAESPFINIDISTGIPYPSMTFADIDGDGDLDCLMAEVSGKAKIFLNYGTIGSPVFQEMTPFAGTFAHHDFGTNSVLGFADIDNDLDHDAVVGISDGTLVYAKNIGAADVGIFHPTTPSPFAGIDVGTNATPTLLDLDADEDFDLIIGAGDGTIYFYENTGDAEIPVYSPVVGVASPFNGISVGTNSKPQFIDIDNDNDQDLFIGAADGTIFFYRNDGGENTPSYVLVTGAGNPFDGIDIGSNSAIAFTDQDQDGDFDSVLTNSAGELYYYQNSGTASSPTFTHVTGALNPWNKHVFNTELALSFIDIDDDGDLDLYAGDSTGKVQFHLNQGQIYTPAFEFLNAFNEITSSFAFLADVDADGDLDLILSGAFRRNIGTPNNPYFISQTGASNPFNGITYIAPALVDIDDDGDLDAFFGHSDGVIYFYENIGTATAPIYSAVVGAGNPMNGVDVGTNSQPWFVDIDNDLDYDLFIGNGGTTPIYYENTGNPSAAVFALGANPASGVSVMSNVSVALADFDGDGDFDLVAGEAHLTVHADSGKFKYYENIGTASSPIFSPTSNPFSHFDFGVYGGRPFAGDLDGDEVENFHAVSGQSYYISTDHQY